MLNSRETNDEIKVLIITLMLIYNHIISYINNIIYNKYETRDNLSISI